jgi:5-methylthioadenosine/S-adenosylhomocysteine deaminase
MKQHCDRIIRAGVLVTQDEQRRVLGDAAVAVTGDTITAVDHADVIAAEWSTDAVSDLSGMLVMPGLVNAHTHVAMTFLRGLADDLPLMQWLTEHIFPVEKHLSAEIVEVSALLGCAEMAATGTTTLCDMYLIEDATFKAVDRAGLRMQGGEGLFAFPSPAYACIEEAFELVRRQHDRYSSHSRIRYAVMPHAVYTSNPEMLTRCAALAGELGCGLHIHLAETAAETAQCLASFGKRPIPYCRDLGVLSPRTTVAHAVDVTDDELEILRESGICVAHNPVSNMKLASGAARVPEMLAAGICVGIGTDGAASNNGLNMFTEMKTCALLHKLRYADPTCVPAATVLDMATTGGAKCAGWPETGALVPGAKADLIALDLSAPNLQPLYSAVSHIVYAATGHEVTHTMVGGEFVYENGRHTRFDYPALLREVASIRRWVQKKITG